MLNREGLDVLIHPLTESSCDDHSKNALWMGAGTNAARCSATDLSP
jgi:aromatic ring-cleaving dioxygenase